ncbi:MAG: DUF2087 domain-containing protein [Filifactoraceae bacterium]
MVDVTLEIKPFLDKDMKLVKIPRKRQKLVFALFYLSQKFEANKLYTEIEINQILKEWHTFNDHVTLRRLLCDMKFLERDKFGKAYKLTEEAFRLEDFQTWITGVKG